MTFTVGSLFSGIGGLELGLEWAGIGPVLWQVEKDAYCRSVLARHWPNVERYDDVCRLDPATLAPVDLICGGFPCQDVSSAGKRAGLSGARSGLWYEFARVVAHCRPRWVVVENVRSGARNWVDAVRGDLERLGYASLPIPIGAVDCGAPHERHRVFVVGATADSHSQQLRIEPRRSSGQGWENPALASQHCGWAAEPGMDRVAYGVPNRMDRERALGNSVVPQCAEVVGRVIQLLAGGAARD